MNFEKIKKAYLPMTETMYYILLSLKENRHGYGIMQYVGQITNNRIILGAGTVYNSLSKLERDGLIKVVEEKDRRKVYAITETGERILEIEVHRLKELYENGIKLLNQN